MPQHINAPITTLEYIPRAFPDYSKEALETIVPYVRPPWWTPPHSICVDTSKDTAEERHKTVVPNQQGIMSIYTDGSAINGHVGASAYCPELQATEVLYLGSEKTQNNFEAEVTAIKTATDMARKANSTYREYNIYADSTAAIIATTKPARQSGQHAIMEAITSIEALQRENPNAKITITWVPSHRAINGNEIADREAKKAAADNDIRRTAPKRAVLKALRQQVINDEFCDENNLINESIC